MALIHAIGIDSEQPRAHKCYTLAKGWLLMRLVIKIFEINGAPDK
jgi:hypothetical protein